MNRFPSRSSRSSFTLLDDERGVGGKWSGAACLPVASDLSACEHAQAGEADRSATFFFCLTHSK